MEVIIAGYNTTVGDNLRPEIISASYARTSRSEKSIPELREEAKLDLENARKSNKNIVFGVGHSSIAEHTVFNIDIIDVSRFLVEEIESHRLASYTEKSQRYVLFKGDYTIPDELFGKDRVEFVHLIEEQNKFYHDLYPILLEYFKKNNLEKYEKEPKTVEGWAKEDARYIISIATQTQLGMTISARNLELMIRRLRACPFIEARNLAEKLFGNVHLIAPSLFPYTEPSELDIKNKERLYTPTGNDRFDEFIGNVFIQNDDSDLLDHKLSQIFYDQHEKETVKNIILHSLKGMKVYDQAPREFEVIDFEYFLAVSASCFAQLKRHRMMTLIPRPYMIENKVIVPKSVIESGMKDKFMEIINKTNNFYKKTKSVYCLTNAHTRLVYVKINLREMYHFCRMRMDLHAQWEIRELANEMNRLAKEICPVGMSLACGKHEFGEVYNSVFGKN